MFHSQKGIQMEAGDRLGHLGSAFLHQPQTRRSLRVQCMADLINSGSKFNGSARSRVQPEGMALINGLKHAEQQVNGLIPLLAAAMIAAEKKAQAPPPPDESLHERSRQPEVGGRLIEKDLVYRQAFVIRSYEVGFDRLASIETLTNLFQETALNHVGMSDFVGDGLGTTHAMIRNGLIWVVTRMHIEVDRYPVWGDIVEIDSWINGSGKNFIRRDFYVRDVSTGATVCRATSTWAMMNKNTRRLSKIPEDVHEEISPYFLDRHVLEEEDGCNKIVKLDDTTAVFVQKNLVPRLHDMDMNQHVNNVKYIGWVLESVPQALLVAHELMSMTLEYRRECAASDVVTSLTSPSQSVDAMNGELEELGPPDIANPVITGKTNLQFTHLLRMQGSGSEILRGRTLWRLKERFSSQ